MFIVYLKEAGTTEQTAEKPGRAEDGSNSGADTNVERPGEKLPALGPEAYAEISFYLSAVASRLRRLAQGAEASNPTSSYAKRLRRQAKTLLDARKGGVLENLTTSELEALAAKALEWDPYALAIEIGR
jgi:hypothetical protein